MRKWIGFSLTSLSLLVCCIHPLQSQQNQEKAADGGKATATEEKSQEKGEKTAEKPKVVEQRFEIQTIDDSKFKLVIVDSSIDMNTQFGKLTIPIKDILYFEIGERISEETKKSIEDGIKKLTSEDKKERIIGKEMIIDVGPQSLHSLRRLRKIVQNVEVNSMIADLEQKFVSLMKEKNIIERIDQDVIQIEGSTFRGLITNEKLKVVTSPFGEQSLKMVDIRRSITMMPQAIDSEGELIDLSQVGTISWEKYIGKNLRVRVTAMRRGVIWGTGTYTGDSDFASAVVHAGVLRQGETGVVKVKVLGPQKSFQGSNQNNMNSQPFGDFPLGFQIISKVDIDNNALNNMLNNNIIRR